MKGKEGTSLPARFGLRPTLVSTPASLRYAGLSALSGLRPRLSARFALSGLAFSRAALGGFVGLLVCVGTRCLGREVFAHRP